MKDIYELLNDIDIDEKEFEEMEVTEFEKAKVKKALKKSLNEKKKRKSWKMKYCGSSRYYRLISFNFWINVSCLCWQYSCHRRYF